MANSGGNKKKKGRRSYLNDIRPNLAGEYVYVGKYYVFVPGQKSFRRVLAEILLFSLLSLLGLIGAGFVSAGGMGNSFYVIIPYMGEAISVFVLLWAVSKLLIKGEKLREYVYGSSVVRIPAASICCTAFAALGIICISVFTVLNGPDGSMGEILFLYAAKIVSAAAPLLLRRLVKAQHWEIAD